MKVLIITALAALALSATATAGNGSVCRNGQTPDGSAFSSMRECQHADEVFGPTLEIEPGHVVAEEVFWLRASGFHANASVTVVWAITGEPPYGSTEMALPTTADGSWAVPFLFLECRKTDTGLDVTVDLTISLVDSFGVHASAPLRLC